MQIIANMDILTEDTFKALESIYQEEEELGNKLIWGVKVSSAVISDSAAIITLFKKYGFKVMVDLRLRGDIIEPCLKPLIAMKADLITIDDFTYRPDKDIVRDRLCLMYHGIDDDINNSDISTVYMDALYENKNVKASIIVNHQEDISDVQMSLYGADMVVYDNILTSSDPVDKVYEIKDKFI